MTTNSHLALGIAQTVFYVPVVPLAVWLMCRNGRVKPKRAWFSLIPFSLMRFGGGIVSVLYEKHPNEGLYIADLLLLNVGTVPLIVVDSGFTRIVLMDNFADTGLSKRVDAVIRFAFIAAVSLLSASAGVSGSGSSSSLRLSRYLTLGGYCVFAVILVSLVSMQLWLFRRRSQLLPSSRLIMNAALAAGPFLIVRNVYGLLDVIFGQDARSSWNPVTGSVAEFTVMALVVEYIATGLYLYAGFTVPPDRGLARENPTEKPSISKELLASNELDATKRTSTSVPSN